MKSFDPAFRDLKTGNHQCALKCYIANKTKQNKTKQNITERFQITPQTQKKQRHRNIESPNKPAVISNKRI